MSDGVKISLEKKSMKTKHNLSFATEELFVRNVFCLSGSAQCISKIFLDSFVSFFNCIVINMICTLVLSLFITLSSDLCLCKKCFEMYNML